MWRHVHWYIASRLYDFLLKLLSLNYCFFLSLNRDIKLVVKTKEFISGRRDREGERSESNFLTAGEAAENCITKRFVNFTLYQGGITRLKARTEETGNVETSELKQ